MYQSDIIQESAVTELEKIIMTPVPAEDIHIISLLIINENTVAPLEFYLEIGGLRASRDIQLSVGDSFDLSMEAKYLIKEGLPVVIKSKGSPLYAVYGHIQRVKVA